MKYFENILKGNSSIQSNRKHPGIRVGREIRNQNYIKQKLELDMLHIRSDKHITQGCKSDSHFFKTSSRGGRCVSVPGHTEHISPVSAVPTPTASAQLCPGTRIFERVWVGGTFESKAEYKP